jgi:hypothetical protein
MDFAKGWVAEDPERLAKFEERFGKQYTREELIRMCENDPAMNAELTRRVIEKWESTEDAVATGRPSKYGTRPAMPVESAEPAPKNALPDSAPLSPDTPEGVIEGGPNAVTPDSGA